jgi:hypothetical protein
MPDGHPPGRLPGGTLSGAWTPASRSWRPRPQRPVESVVGPSPSGRPETRDAGGQTWQRALALEARSWATQSDRPRPQRHPARPSRSARRVTPGASPRLVAATEQLDSGTPPVSVMGEVDLATARALEQTLLGVPDYPTGGGDRRPDGLAAFSTPGGSGPWSPPGRASSARTDGWRSSCRTRAC